MEDEEELAQLRQSSTYKKVAPVRNKPAPQATLEESTEEPEELEQYHLPTSFGAKEKSFHIPQNVEKTKRKVVGPSRSAHNVNRDDAAEEPFVGPPRPSEVQVFEEDSNYYNIPFSHEIQLKGHSRMISALALDPAGSRLISGAYDCAIKFWDFAGMDAGLRSFRSVEPAEGNQIKSVSYSPSGDKFVVATNNWQPKIYNRDGFEQSECVKGDMYLHDPINTKGHTSSVGRAVWRPNDKNTFVSCSLDSTIRIWDLETIKRKQKQVIKLKTDNGRKVPVLTCAFSHDGEWIAGGCQDGSIQLYQMKGPFNRPGLSIKGAHSEGNEITCVTFSNDGSTLISRSMDDSMKVWDIRKSNSPLATFDDLPNFGEVNCIFSPDEKLILTGTSVKKGEGTGLLVFYDKSTLSRVKQIGIASGAGVVVTQWHPKINQIVVGTSEANIHVLYDPKLSHNGALLSIVRAPRQKDPNDFEPARPILTPHSLPMFAETPNAKRKEARSRLDPSKSAKIAAGPAAPRAGNSVTQHLMKNWIAKDNSREEDPREALLKYAKEAEENPIFAGAYKKTQPKPIFDTTEEPESGRVKPKEDQ